MVLRACCVLLMVVMCTSCWKNEDYTKDLIGTGVLNGDAVSYSSCEEADYGNWKESQYNLPYPVGSSYVIGLGPCGGSYHSPGQPDMFAIDFNMPIGHKILAARSGEVVYVEESGKDFGFPNNLVAVQHTDGTFGYYMHLTFEGAVVNVGEYVAQGALLGYSGSTGLAGYPHLHFVVTAKGDFGYPYTSIPINFKNTLPNERSLESGVRYEALPNGG